MSQYQKTMDDRSVGAFVTKKDKRNYWTILSILLILGVSSAFGLLVYNNPVPVTSHSFFHVVSRRLNAIISM